MGNTFLSVLTQSAGTFPRFGVWCVPAGHCRRGVAVEMGQPEAPDAPHIPVLLDEVLAALQPLEGARIVDGTFGAGGYSRALLKAGASVIAIDRDPSVIAFAEALKAEF